MISLTTSNQMVLASPEATFEFGKALAKLLPDRWFLALHGDLGAGKTTFVKGLVNGYDCADEASSPTFSIIQIYAGATPVVHCDWYRLERESELTALGWDEMVDNDPKIVVEWVERFPNSVPKFARHLHFSYCQDERIVTIGDGW